AFWTHRRQVAIALDLARLADVVVTNTAANALDLYQGASASCEVLPIPSTIPVGDGAWPEGDETGIGVMVFGRPAVRFRCLRRHRPLLGGLARTGRLRRGVVVGSGPGAAAPAPPEARPLAGVVAPHRIELHGEVDPAGVSQLFGRTHVALVAT